MQKFFRGKNKLKLRMAIGVVVVVAVAASVTFSNWEFLKGTIVAPFDPVRMCERVKSDCKNKNECVKYETSCKEIVIVSIPKSINPDSAKVWLGQGKVTFLTFDVLAMEDAYLNGLNVNFESPVGVKNLSLVNDQGEVSGSGVSVDYANRDFVVTASPVFLPAGVRKTFYLKADVLSARTPYLGYSMSAHVEKMTIVRNVGIKMTNGSGRMVQEKPRQAMGVKVMGLPLKGYRFKIVSGLAN